MQPLLLSQRDERWGRLTLGTSDVTIASHGCTITVLAMRFRLTPDVVNTVMKAFGGYVDGNLVNWTKLNEAFPGISFVYRQREYKDTYNELISQHLPCPIEVDASPIGGNRHWVLYVGNGKIYDPWDGKEKSATAYRWTGFTLLKGEYYSKDEEEKKETPQAAPSYNPADFYGLDPTNRETFKITAKIWHEVVHEGKYISIEQHNEIVNKIKSAEVNGGGLSKEDAEDLVRYRQMKALGYNTVEDVSNAIHKVNEKNTRLLQDIVVIEKKNETLATTIAGESRNTYAAVETALHEMKQKEDLEHSIEEIAKVAEAEKPTTNSIIKNIFRYKDLADRFLKEREEKEVVKSDNVQTVPVKKEGVNYLLQLFRLPQSKEVK